MSSGLRVLVVDPHPIYRRGVAASLSSHPSIATVIEAACPPPVRDDGADLELDVVVLDDDAPRALEFIRSATDRGGRALVCSSGSGADRVLAAVEAGAVGFLLKDSLTPESLAAAVQAAASGAGVMPPEILGSVLRGITRASRDTLAPRGLTLSQLTVREQQVLRLVAGGHPTREVARKLSYSERTIKNVMHDVVLKMHARSRSQAIAAAVRQGLI